MSDLGIVATIEEVPELDADARAKLLACLDEAKKDIEAGRFVEYDPYLLKERLLEIYRGCRAQNCC